MLSLLASLYTRLITGMPIKDPTGGFKCFRRHTLASLNLDKILFKGYAFQIEINYKIWRNGGRIKEVPIIFYERREGASKMSRSLVIEAFFGMMKLRLMSLFGFL
jgi:dolichol-phosphate mannosyltransferase